MATSEEHNIIKRYFPELSDHKIDKLVAFGNFIIEKNKYINLISRKDIQNIWIRHIVHSLSLIKFVKFPEKAKVIDVGTGGGFPGIPLAIIFDKTDFTLIDARRKKINVLQEAINMLELKNTKAIWIRSEEHKEKYDIIVARAVANIPKFLSQTKHLLKPSSKIYYYKGCNDEDIKAYKEKFPLSKFFNEDFFLERCILYLTPENVKAYVK